MSEAQPVRFGLVGCGRIGSTADDRVRRWPNADLWYPYAHASAIVATPGAELVAVCDLDAAAAGDAQRRHGAARTYTSHDEMLAREKLDAVAIATRTAARGNVIRAALAAGVRGLYCEKPLSNTLEDADGLASAVVRSGAYFVYGTKRRYMPLYEGLRARLQAGDIGEVKTITIRFGLTTLLWTYPHGVDLASFLTGDSLVTSVQADLALDAAPGTDIIEADPILYGAIITYANGARAFLVAGPGFDVHVAGDKGLLALEGDGKWVRWRRPFADGSDLGMLYRETTDPPPSPSSGTQRSIAALVRAVQYGVHPGYEIADAVRNQEVLFAMVESQLRGGARVPVPLERRGLCLLGRTGDVLA